MRLTARNGVATGFSAAAIAVRTSHATGADITGLSGVRPLAGVILGLGFAAALANEITTDPCRRCTCGG